MIKQILAEFDRTDAPLDLDELSQRLNIQKSALQGMLTTLVRQGKLEKDSETAGLVQSCGRFQCMGCSVSSKCPFIGKMPASYAKVNRQPPHGSRTQR